MQNIQDKLILTAADLAKMEQRLCDNLGRFLSFGGHELYFPKKMQDNGALFLPGEKRLILPLIWRGKQLGMIMLENARIKDARRMEFRLPAIVEMCLENLALGRALKHDASTGLATEESFFEYMRREVEELHAILADPSQSAQRFNPLYKICLGMLVIIWRDAHSLANEFDYDFCGRVFMDMAAALGSILPAEAVAAPLGRYEGRYEFGILFPASGRGVCQKIAKVALDRLESLVFQDIASKRVVRPGLFIGHALYPQDMLGEEMRLPIFEQALRLRDRARLAGNMAKNLLTGGPDGNIMAFSHVLRKGGRIIENLGKGKVRINLGIAANAREGMRFQVVGSDSANGRAVSKCQIVLLETHIKDSLAEIFFMEESGLLPMPGDGLLFLDAQTRPELAEQELSGDAGIESGADGVGIKLWSHALFWSAFAEAARKSSRFVLGISRISHSPCLPDEAMTAQMNAFFEKAVEQISAGNGHFLPRPLLAGRYGSNGLIFYHDGIAAGQCRDFYMDLASLAEQCGFELFCGLFEYPFLDYAKEDSENCALKAMEYGRLLPKPRIGVCDSLALTISADNKYALGDSFGAIEEYRRALLADRRNAVARNSLGVCMAALGKREEAIKLFAEALRACDDVGLQAKICYNLATAFQKQNDLRKAGHFYRRCIKLAPDHVFAWIRLGQMHEQRGKKSAARKFYEQAASLAGDNQEFANLARRCLARLANSQKQTEKARETIHDILLRNPDDPAALLLLARMYLDGGEDFGMAETLARKSASINGAAEAWKVLADALEAQGKHDEAEIARARASR